MLVLLNKNWFWGDRTSFKDLGKVGFICFLGFWELGLLKKLVFLHFSLVLSRNVGFAEQKLVFKSRSLEKLVFLHVSLVMKRNVGFL